MQEGENRVVLSNEGAPMTLFVDGCHGSVPALNDTDVHTASSRSFDGGTTWHPLCCEDGSSGEWMVRLHIHGRPTKGVVVSPVLDLADPASTGTTVAPEGFGALAVHAQVVVDTPRGTAAQLQVRLGSTPAVSERTWRAWQVVLGAGRSSAVSTDGAGLRFVQWRCVLTTESTANTPTLSQVTLTACVASSAHHESGGSVEPAPRLTGNLPPLARSQWQFAHQVPHPRGVQLRAQLRLETVVEEWAPRMRVQGAPPDLVQLIAVRTHVHAQWLGWQLGTKPACPSWDALDILTAVKGDFGFGMCTHYSATFVGAAGALGFHARCVCIGGTHGGGGHCIAEAWVPSLRKWVIMDTGPSRDFSAHYTSLEGEPLSALELSRRIRASGGTGRKVLVHKTTDLSTDETVQNLASCPELQSLIVNHIRTFAIPSRADYTLAPELTYGPGQQGYGGHTYGGLLHFLDLGAYTAASYTALRREAIFWSECHADLYPSVGECRLYFAAREARGQIDVLIEGTMPALDAYEAQVDGGAWTTAQQWVGVGVGVGHAADACFVWSLHAGANALAVRAVSRFGRTGPPTTVQAILAPACTPLE